jgi:uncharacterized repeat protein (TIGR01451 family)
MKQKYPFLLVLALALIPSATQAQSFFETARNYLISQQAKGDFTESDLADLMVTSSYRSEHNGVTHLYLRQRYQGIEVFGADLNFNFDPEGRLVLPGGQVAGRLSSIGNVPTPQLSALQALRVAAAQHRVKIEGTPAIIEAASGPDQRTTFSHEGFALDPVPVRLVFFRNEKTYHLAWMVELYPLDAQHNWLTLVDAANGEILHAEDRVTECGIEHQPAGLFFHNDHLHLPAGAAAVFARPMAPNDYRVYAMPVESPSHGNRTLVANPADPTASPYGWHDTNGANGAEYTTTRGNNVDAYEDANADNAAGFRPSGGANLVFDFPLDLTQAPSTYQSAAITNLFYWSNVVHDVTYQYGFNEVSGNFQVNNYGRGGLGSDDVRAEAQDGSGFNNANFFTPVDGSRARMQMYLWDAPNPDRDGDFDNGIIVHEYGHGVSTRLTGGPGNSSCLGSTVQQQMGEGWSDWLGLMLTMEPGDEATDRRGIGTYALEQPVTGNGIRTYPYSTDLAINPQTYDDIKTAAVPHGVGAVWCAMLWEMTWGLIDQYGFDTDIYHGTGGNNIAMQLVLDGMKLQPCNPGFVDGRNAILEADTLLSGGANGCIIWNAFAKRGLGYSAIQGSSSNRTGLVEAFDIPPICERVLKTYLTADTDSVPAGGEITYSIKAVNKKTTPLTGVVLSQTLPATVTYVPGSASNGGSESAGVVSFPGVNIPAGDSVTRTFRVLTAASPYTNVFFTDNATGANTLWTLSSLSGATKNWRKSTLNAPAGTAWFGPDSSVVTDFVFALTNTFVPTVYTRLNFDHFYDLESGFDGGVVEISVNGGAWTDLGPYITAGAYSRTISNMYSNPIGGRQAFSGLASGVVNSSIDLSTFAGQPVQVRFRVGTDNAVADVGWSVDNISAASVVAITAEACALAVEGDQACATLSDPGVVVIPPVATLPVEDLYLEAVPGNGTVRLNWTTRRETNNRGFTVERLDPGAADFAALGWVNGNGTTYSVRNYQYTDRSVHAGATYLYRLRQVDMDGTEHLSAVVEVRLGPDLASQRPVWYPNPANGHVVVKYAPAQGNTRVRVTDLQGKTIQNTAFEPAQLAEGFRVSLEGLSKGVYLMELTTGEERFVERLVVE